VSLTRISRLGVLALVAAATACALAGCSGTKRKTAAPAGLVTSTAARDRWGTVWLCRPGERDNPCLSNLTTTVVGPHQTTRLERAVPAANPPIDCFYVYPTISGERTINADLTIGFRERAVALTQAARFSQVCRVYAPVYRQVTLSALNHPGRIGLRNALIAYRSILAAFRTYLAHYNEGRGIVFIGHSQGAVLLIRLLQQHLDGTPSLRRRLVSALLLGGNVTVARGRNARGDFRYIPACASLRQIGCVVAYSSFAGKPATNSQFGRTTSAAGVAPLAPPDRSADRRILCVNPASPGGGAGRLVPALPSFVLAYLSTKGIPRVSTPWVALPGRFTARCESSGNATWLQISEAGGGTPLLGRLRDAAIGLHILDVTVALDNLVRLVRAQATAYTQAR
jgi:pimeloyl-ACP methyl ester carboxylesterase